MKTYELITAIQGEMLKATLQDGSVLWIPLDSANRDYAEYLRLQDWLAAGKKETDFWKQSEAI